jgi:hypothetical protein
VQVWLAAWRWVSYFGGGLQHPATDGMCIVNVFDAQTAQSLMLCILQVLPWSSLTTMPWKQ